MLWVVWCVALRTCALSLLVLACSASDRPPALSDTDGQGDGGDGSIDVDVREPPCTGPPPPEAAGYCGNEVVQILTDKPNVYFVLDGSGSMHDEFEGTRVSKLLTAKRAIRDMLREIGHRIKYGAAVFPDTALGEACAAGSQVFPTTEGDAVLCEQADGPVLETFLDRIGFRQASGGTTIAATLSDLTPTLLGLSPRTSLILITDGAPNCNPELSCDAASCIPNLEQQQLGDLVCGDDLDCCDPAVLPEAGRNCIDDRDSEAVLEELEESGIQSYIVGMPGSEVFAEALDRMAQAGGTARAADTGPLYYSVRDTADLAESLFSIGSELSLSCRISLQELPPDPDLINVYFDSDLVDLDSNDGWSLAEEAVIELHGTACDVLKGGTVSQVQVVAGCPTIIE